jgi:hypothetical protein
MKTVVKTVTNTPVRAKRTVIRRRQRVRRRVNSKLPLRNSDLRVVGAPVASGLTRRSPRSGVFMPSRLYTSDLMDTVALGVAARTIVYQTSLSPQDLPIGSRGRRMATLFAKYRCLSMEIRIESAISTSAGGQYAAFFDPNPANVWEGTAALGSLTSMPVQDVAASWQCLRLNIPAAELERATELYTQAETTERLVTRVGQLVLLTLAAPTTTPAGAGEVTVWVDATWEFYEPNASAGEIALSPSHIPAGSWTIASTKIITHPVEVPLLGRNTVWQAYPSIPGTFVSSGAVVEWLATDNGPTLYAFPDEAAAHVCAETNATALALGPGIDATQAFPAMVLVPVRSYALSR